MALATLASGIDSGPTTGTKYQPLNSGRGRWNATESFGQIVYRTAGTFTKLYAYVKTNASSVTTTLATRKNGGAGNLTVSIGAGATGAFTDTTHSDTVAAGDQFNYIVSGHDGNLSIFITSVIYTVTGKAVSRSTSLYAGTLANSTVYVSPAGTVEPYIANTTTESDAYYTAKYSLTQSNLFVNAFTNASGNDCTVKNRKNGADGTLTLTVTASTTGFFEDTTHSDTFTSGDHMSYSWTRGASSGGLLAWVGSDIADLSTGKSLQMGFSDELNQGLTIPQYMFSGSEQDSEAAGQNKMQQSGTASNFQVSIRNNGGTGTTNMVSRLNTANGNMAIAVTTGGTGIFTDDTHTDTLALNDLYAMKWTKDGTGGGGQIIDINFFAFVVADTTPAPSTTNASFLLNMI